MGQFLLPAGGDQLLIGNCIDVIGQRQGDHVGLKAIDDCTCLLAGTAVGLFDGDLVTGLLLPVLGKCIVEIGIQFTGRIVGYVQQRDICGKGRKGGDKCQDGYGQGCEGLFDEHN